MTRFLKRKVKHHCCGRSLENSNASADVLWTATPMFDSFIDAEERKWGRWKNIGTWKNIDRRAKWRMCLVSAYIDWLREHLSSRLTMYTVCGVLSPKTTQAKKCRRPSTSPYPGTNGPQLTKRTNAAQPNSSSLLHHHLKTNSKSLRDGKHRRVAR